MSANARTKRTGGVEKIPVETTQTIKKYRYNYQQLCLLTLLQSAKALPKPIKAGLLTYSNIQAFPNYSVA